MPTKLSLILQFALLVLPALSMSAATSEQDKTRVSRDFCFSSSGLSLLLKSPLLLLNRSRQEAEPPEGSKAPSRVGATLSAD